MAVGAGSSILQLTPCACQGFHKRVSLCQFWKQRRTIWQIWWTKVYGKAANTIQCIFWVNNDSKGNEKLESESERGSWNVEQNAGFTCDRLGNRPEQPNLPNLLPSVSIQIGIHCRKSSGKIETRTKLLCWEIFYTEYFFHVLKCLMRFQKTFEGLWSILQDYQLHVMISKQAKLSFRAFLSFVCNWLVLGQKTRVACICEFPQRPPSRSRCVL